MKTITELKHLPLIALLALQFAHCTEDGSQVLPEDFLADLHNASDLLERDLHTNPDLSPEDTNPDSSAEDAQDTRHTDVIQDGQQQDNSLPGLDLAGEVSADIQPDNSASYQPLVINEIGCHGIDFIEIYNVSEEAIDLTGWIVNDALDTDEGYALTPEEPLPVGGFYLVSEAQILPGVITDDPESITGFDFGIDCDSETVALFDSTGALVTSATTDPVGGNFTSGRLPDGSETWTETASTPGEPNMPTTAFSIALNEISCQDDEWIEIYNNGTVTADLNGWLVDDDSDPSGGYALIAEPLLAGTHLLIERDSETALGFDFGIGCGTETVTLFDRDGTETDAVFVEETLDWVTWGRLPDGTGGWTETTPTPGEGNQEPLTVDFLPRGGTFVTSTEISLSSPIEEAEILYTLNGLPPSYSLTDDGTVELADGTLRYVTPLVLEDSTTMIAVATAGGFSGELLMQSYIEIASSLSDFTSDIPLVVLHSFEDAPDLPREGVRTPFTMNIFEPSPDRASLLGEANLSVRIGLDVRGSSSSGHPKKPYSIETWAPGYDDDFAVPILDLPTESDWVFYAPIQFDRGLIRNAFMYELSNDVGQYASRTRFVEVYVTDDGSLVRPDDYVGVYSIIEQIKRGADRVDVDRLTTDDNDLPEIAGGYMYKVDRLGGGESGFWGGGNLLVWVYPQEETVTWQQSDWLSDYIGDYTDALEAPGFMHPVTGEHYSEWLDIDSWIDHHILNIVSKNPDALRLSGYFYKDREGPIVIGPIWDFDRTLFCDSDSRADDPTWWDASNWTGDTTAMFTYMWYDELFLDSWFTEQYWNRWRELLETELSVEHMHEIIDRMAVELAESAPRNFDQWTGYPPRGGSFESEINLMKNWLAQRHDWISDCLGMANPRNCTGE
jgi:hypothetical protein